MTETIPVSAVDLNDRESKHLSIGQPEGISITKSSRGDKMAIELFVAEVWAWEAGLR